MLTADLQFALTLTWAQRCALFPALRSLKETEASIANKIGRGTFSATFLLASLKAVEADVVRLENV